MDKLITLADVQASAELAIAEKPDGYIYTNESGIEANHKEKISCLYVHVFRDDDDETMVTGCIVGNILHRLGFSLQDMRDWDGWIDDMLMHDDKALFAPDALAFLSKVQMQQDDGYSWRDAVNRANVQFVND